MEGRDKFLILIPISIALQMVAHQFGGRWADAWASDILLVSIGYVIPGLLAHDIATQGVRNTLLSVSGLGLVIGVAACMVAYVAPAPAVAGAQLVDAALSFEIQWLHFAMLFSVVASIALVYNHGLRAGGFVGAAYVALFATRPVELLYIVVLSLATYVIVTRWLMPRMIIFGRRKFAAMMLVAALLSWGTLLVREQVSGFAGLPFASSTFALISLTLTGLFANDMERAGIWRVAQGTVLSVLFTLSATLLVVQGNENGDPAVMLPLSLLAAVTGWVIFGPQLRTIASICTPDWAKSHSARMPAMAASNPTEANLAQHGRGQTVRVGRLAGQVSFVMLALAVRASLSLVPPVREAPLLVHNALYPSNREAVAVADDSSESPRGTGDSTRSVDAGAYADAARTPAPDLRIAFSEPLLVRRDRP